MLNKYGSYLRMEQDKMNELLYLELVRMYTNKLSLLFLSGSPNHANLKAFGKKMTTCT